VKDRAVKDGGGRRRTAVVALPVPPASSPDARRRMKAVRTAGTEPELALQAALLRLGLRFEIDARPIPEIRRRADLVFRRVKVACFVHGCYWHGCPKHATWPKANAEFWKQKLEANRRRDRDTARTLRRAGWVVLTCWEHDRPSVVAARIAAAVRQARPGSPA
jgi:DNA mismatch endonuclease (patch repair protein)